MPKAGVSGTSEHDCPTMFCGHAFAAARTAKTLERLADLLAEAGDETAASNARREAAQRLGEFRLPAI